MRVMFAVVCVCVCKYAWPSMPMEADSELGILEAGGHRHPGGVWQVRTGAETRATRLKAEEGSREKHATESPGASRWTTPQHLDCRCAARERTSLLFEATQAVGICYDSPRDQRQLGPPYPRA